MFVFLSPSGLPERNEVTKKKSRGILKEEDMKNRLIMFI